MKLIIDIDDYDKEWITNGYCIPNVINGKIAKAIINGIPLPKGHGRLGDLSKIYVELNEAQIDGAEEYRGLGEAKQIVCNAPTIIEADKEGKRMSICDRCIHDYVCGLEDNHEEGIVSCADMIPKDVLNKIRAEISEFKDDKIIHAERNEMIDIVLEILDKYRNEVNE